MNARLSRAYVATQAMLGNLIEALPNVVLALLVLMVFLFLARGARALATRLTAELRRARTLGLLLGRLAQATVAVIGVLVALSIIVPSFSARDLIQLLGIGSVAIGFAFRDILQNFLAGILLLLTEPFTIGDEIVVDTFAGTIEDIETRATTIRTFDGCRVVIPNSQLLTESVTVNTAWGQRQSEYDITIAEDADVAEAKKLVGEAVTGVDGVLAQPAPDTLVVEAGGGEIRIRTRWWTASQRATVQAVHDNVVTAIRSALAGLQRSQAPAATTPQRGRYARR